MTTEEDQFVTVRMPTSMRDDLRELAKRNDRTLAAEIRLAIRERLEAEEAQAVRG